MPIPADLLDAGMCTVIAEAAAWESPDSGDPTAEARAFASAFTRWSRPVLPVESVEDVLIAGPRRQLRMRIYRPRAAAAPLALFIHGGGWIAGSIEISDRICRRLCNGSGHIIASVDYALAPEEPYPAALDDCVAALTWLGKHSRFIGASGLEPVVVGESAGANLAAALCLRAREDGLQSIARQVLICPVLDDSTKTESHRRWGNGDYLLTSAALGASWRTYLGARSIDAFAAPLRATNLGALPAAVIVVAGCDPLRDDGVAYARKLTAAGTAVELIEANGLLHAFIYMDGVSRAAAETVDRICALHPENEDLED
jgi:acetyl esterase